MKTTSFSELRALTNRIVNAGDTLWHAGAARRAAWLSKAFAQLASAQGGLFTSALEQVPQSTLLSREMVQWALESALAPLDQQALLALHDRAPLPSARAIRARPGRLCVVVLAGNVFTAAARAVAMPLLFGMPVLAKAASDDASFVRLLHRALRDADRELGEAFQTVTFASQDEAQSSVLFEQADVVSVFGSDNTLNTIRAHLSATVSFVGHGHGLGAAFIDGGVLQERARAQRAAEQLAFDIAAYDQRGCMSPLVAWVRDEQPISPEHFAELLHHALSALDRQLPRGPLPIDVASAQLSFRGIAAMRGSLWEGSTHAVAYEGDGPLRLAPGYRNVQLLTVPSVGALCERLAPLGVHLKCLGVAGSEVRELVAQLPARVAPRVCEVGAMQTPKVDALHDGIPAWEGLLRYVELDD